MPAGASQSRARPNTRFSMTFKTVQCTSLTRRCLYHMPVRTGNATLEQAQVCMPRQQLECALRGWGVDVGSVRRQKCQLQ